MTSPVEPRDHDDMADRAEKARRKAAVAPYLEAQQGEERRRIRQEHGDAFANLVEALESLWATYQKRPHELTPLQQAVLDAWVLSGVVGNGGFEAWLESNGRRASATAAGLRLLGVPELAEVVDAVIGATRSVVGADRDAETRSTADQSAELEVLSEQVWKLDDRLTEAMTAAVETNPSEFRRPA